MGTGKSPLRNRIERKQHSPRQRIIRIQTHAVWFVYCPCNVSTCHGTSSDTFTMCLCYLDDVIVFGRNIEEHNVGLAAVLSRFRLHNLRVKLSKCKFAARTVTYLGHQISQHGVSPDPTKIAAVRDMPTPRSIKDVRSLLCTQLCQCLRPTHPLNPEACIF